MSDIFLSYASQDRDRIRPLVRMIEAQGWSVWWDRKIPPGKTFDQVIEQALDEARCVVVVWSQNSVQSEWVRVEADEGMNRKILVPVLIDDVRIPLAYRRIQAARLVGWQGDLSDHEFVTLIDAIRSITGDPLPERKPAEKREKPEPRVVEPKKPSWPILSTFEFEVVGLDAQGDVVERRKRSAQYFSEDLGGVKLEMVEIQGGNFEMGSNEEESEQPVHRVTISPFYIGKFTITQKQWGAVADRERVESELERDPSHFKGDDRPVESVSWFDAVEFCARLAKKTGHAYRLPTEAEWEYACRAGTTTPFAFGETITPEFVNYNGEHPYGKAMKGKNRGETVPVGSLGVANAFGLFDMHGNVWEWCGDWYGEYPSESQTDPTGQEEGGFRVLRGGSFGLNGYLCRSAYRYDYPPDVRLYDLGFRVVVPARTK